jgi:hypothetical protein
MIMYNAHSFVFTTPFMFIKSGIFVFYLKNFRWGTLFVARNKSCNVTLTFCQIYNIVEEILRSKCMIRQEAI